MQAENTKKIKYAKYKQGDSRMKEVIYVRIEKELKQKLDMLALQENRSLNNFIVTLLTKYIEEKEKTA